MINRKFILLLTIILLLFLFGFKGCSQKDKWEYIRAVTNHVKLPVELPTKYLTPKGARVYSSVRPSAIVLALVDEGLTNQLARSSRDNPNFKPRDAWRKWKSYDQVNEYDIVLVEPEARSVMPETLDCPLIGVAGVGTAAGTNIGVILVNQKPKAPAGNYLIIPRLDRESEERCRILFRNGVDHESEHARLLDSPEVYLAYTGQWDIHPIFP